ncbi:MAG: xanthine phosphoribosyltransferase [Firmicutes bacterium]|nr:xanthine phosphoribosyltransferase [Bacillota bacterium]
MKEMQEKILAEGKVISGGILKVGSFLNQQIDTDFLKKMGKEIAELYSGEKIDKILTIEASGISIAVAAGMEIGVPVVFAKKHLTSNVDGAFYSADVHSFTRDEDYSVVVSIDFLSQGERILIVDDFLANGQALNGLLSLVKQAGAEPVGVAVAIEKCFQGGGDEIRGRGIRVEALAAIESMSADTIVFRNN